MGSVRLAGITKRYDDVTAVKDMNLDIEDGEFISLVGPSGCGKSTTLETIGGLTEPTEGTVNIDGEDVTGLPPKDRDLAMVFQNIALFPHMDVYDNMSYGLRVRKVEKDRVDRRVDEAAEIVQLKGMLDRMPSELSGGQRQRVAIGRAIVREPEVFLMDEPLANLDAKLRVHMRTELQRIQRKLDVTTIYVTHDQEEAMTMSDRIAIINHGELQQIAPPLTCYNEPANVFVAGFIGSPSMNMFAGTVTDGRLATDEFDVSLEGTDFSDGTDVTVGVRPDDVHWENAVDDSIPTTSPIEAYVDVMQPIGEKIYVYLQFEDPIARETVSVGDNENAQDQFLMGADSDVDIEEGQTIDVVFDRSNLHLFDMSTGDALVHGISDVDE
ncbi:ABC transporter ATP-binding protein [Halorhabdus amylolytica]|uniref:ABC transporter ATP-binding protein n=1 Tax=Halorhabdus amylolytica TaxID=2559573 RepID=UPI0010AA44A1|nr:ABC transporter ATP-binding protein [Halorhabdus amylolytica]